LRRPAIERTLANKTKAISFAAYRCLMDLFPADKPKYDSLMSSLGYDPTDVSVDTTKPSGIGNVASAAVIQFRHTDGSNQLGDLHPGAYSDYTGYVPVNTVTTVNDPNHWQPLQFSDGHGGFVTPGYLGAQWGLVKPFALTDLAALRPPQPAQFGSAEYLAQAQRVVDFQANLTDEQKVIAEYWKDGPRSVTPPGHWCLFGQSISIRDRHTLDDDVKFFFILANAEMDSSICCWDVKRTYDYVRPITAIHVLFAGKTITGWGGPGLGNVHEDGANWIPYQPATFITPPFPEFMSGHSTFSAAGAEILRRFTGSDSFGLSVTYPPGSTVLEPGLTPAQTVVLSWNTFSEAADQAGMSRQYGGIHFQNGDLTARAKGRQIAQIVWDKAQTYINGTAVD